MEKLESNAIDCGHCVYDEVGPGLLQPVYEALLTHRLTQSGRTVERQKPVPIVFDGLEFDEGFRCDILVDGKLLVAVKSAEQLQPVHSQQVATYLRLMDLPVGLIMNFGAASFKHGVRRIVNGR